MAPKRLDKLVGAVGLMAANLLGCGGDGTGRPSPAPPQWFDPDGVGPYPVGVTSVRVTDPARVDPKTHAPRELRVEIWYPAAEAARDQPLDHLDFASDAPAELASQIGDAGFPVVEQPAVRDAAPREEDGPFAVILYSHAYGGSRNQAAYLTTHLASQGYVVVAADHTGTTMYDMVHVTGEWRNDAIAHATDRPLDLTALIDRLEAGTLTSGSIEPPVDLSRLGVMGHSIGGTACLLVTSTASSFYDERVRASVPIAPPTQAAWLFGPLNAIEVPTLYFGGMKDGLAPYDTEVVPGYEAHVSRAGLVGIAGAGHFGFTDWCDDAFLAAADRFYDNPTWRAVLHDGCGSAYVPTERTHLFTKRYASVWFDELLRGEEDEARAYLDPSGVPDDIEMRLTP